MILISDSAPARHRYRTIEFGKTDIHVRALRDNQQFDDPDGVAEDFGVSSSTWPLFGLIWESSEILARLMADFDIAGKRILEVGCGLGLSSLVLNTRSADITATDHHPDAGAYLAWNVRLNGGQPIPFVRTGWEDHSDTLGEFDLIIGSDVLYQRDHPDLLSAFIADHACEHCQVIVVDPARGNAAKFTKGMIAQGFLQNDIPVAQYLSEDQQFKGQVRNYLR